MSHALLTALALFPALAWIPAEDPPGETPDPAYLELTNSRRSVTNLNIETIRGMAWDAGQSRLYAVNTHGSFLVYFGTPLTPPAVTPPVQTFRTINNPTALGLWDDGAGRHYAIVVGGSSHGVVKQDRDTGEVLDWLDLPAEPKDIVIDEENGLAYVSCAGAFDKPIPPLAPPVPRSGGVVMRIDLNSFAFNGGTPAGSGKHFIDAMRPTFLNIEIGAGSLDNVVYVTPLLSGNTSTFQTIVDTSVVLAPDLPDEDLFAIDELGNVTPVLTGAGTLLTAHMRNPSSDEYWILNVESLNAAQHTEPAHRGRFAENRVTTAVQGLGGFTGNPPVSLDGTTAAQTPLGVAGANKPASFPFGIDMYSNGEAVVVSSTGDTVRILDRSAATLRNIGLPVGSIPRGALLSPDEQRLWIYAWGTNTILEYDAAAILLGSTSSVTPKLFDLGVDPLPLAAKHGREIWYDADNSEDKHVNPSVVGKVTCNTCHPAGAMDMLGWDLGDPPGDRKDTMVTQSLLSIEDTFPYHWRGERSLSEFNGAFEFLLGGSQLNIDDGDLADFESFVFSLQGSANPRQNRDRVLDDTKNIVRFMGAVGSAVNGQQVYHTEPDVLNGFRPSTCLDCHSAESGSNGLITQDNITLIGSNVNLDVSHLRQLQHKFFQPVTTTSIGARPRGGFGFSQDGDDLDIDSFFDAGFFVFSPNPSQSRADAASFVVQFDQGIAPRAHGGALFRQSSLAADLAEASALYAQAQAGHCDLVVIGHWMNGAVPTVPLALWYDPSSVLFWTGEAGTSISIDYNGLNTLRSQGILQLVMLGLPLGNGFRFAVDHDDDGASNTVEATFPTTWGPVLDRMDADSDNDGFPDGYELAHFSVTTGVGSNPRVFTTPAQMAAADPTAPTIVSAVEEFVDGRQGKFLVEFSEPVSYEIQVLRRSPATGLFVPHGPVQSRPAKRTKDTLVAHQLIPSIDISTAIGPALRLEDYRFRVSMTDYAGNTFPQDIPSATTSVRSRDAVFTQLPIVPALVTKSLALSPASGSNVTLTVDIDDTWEGAAAGTTPMPSFAGSKTVIAQFLVETSPGSGEYGHPAGTVTVTPGTGTRRETLMHFCINPTNPLDPPVISYGTGGVVDGAFLLATTNAAGLANLSWSVTGLAAGINVRINLIGVYQEAPIVTSPPRFEILSPAFWQLPMVPSELRGWNYTL